MFTHQFKFLLLFALQLFDVLGEVSSVKISMKPRLDLQNFLRNATEGLSYLVNQLLIVLKVVMRPSPQVGFVSSEQPQKNK